MAILKRLLGLKRKTSDEEKRKNISKRTLKDGTKVKMKGRKDGSLKKIVKRKGLKRVVTRFDKDSKPIKRGGRDKKKYHAPGGEERRKESTEKYGKRHTTLREKAHKLRKKSDDSFDAGKEKKSDRQFKRFERKSKKARAIRTKTQIFRNTVTPKD